MNKLVAALNKCGYETIGEPTKSVTQVRVVGRVLDNKKWMESVGKLLGAADSTTHWKLDLSKHFILVGGLPKYEWRLIFQFDPSESDKIVGIISTDITPFVELEEADMAFSYNYRNVAPSGKALVGPAAAYALSSGRGQ